MTKAEKRAAAINGLKAQAKAEGQPPNVDHFLTLLHDMLDSLERIAVALETKAASPE